MELELHVRRTARRRQDLQQLVHIANGDSSDHTDMHTINLIATPVCGRYYTLPRLHRAILAEFSTPFSFSGPISNERRRSGSRSLRIPKYRRRPQLAPLRSNETESDWNYQVGPRTPELPNPGPWWFRTCRDQPL